ncbi:hypothetical protein MW887_008757 [Aspergillus wentii]|nr:hypothetical protein MW887_008757 [Aspergillus wentii]
MDPLLDFFTRHVISAYTTGDRTRTGPKPNKTTTTADDYEENDFHFGITDNLLSLISRIATLHALPRPESGLTPATTISAALAIWHDLQNWRPPTMIPSREFDAIYGAYSSALFIWLYLLIHPDNVTDEKVQKMYIEFIN